MEEFIDYSKVIMGTLGHKLFEPISKVVEVKAEPEHVSDVEYVKLHLSRTIKKLGKVEADGAQTAEGFVVFAGSHISSEEDDAIPFLETAAPD